MSLQVWPCALTNELLLEICPYRQNRYSCILSRADSGILSGYLLEAAAFVERGADGHPRGMLWKSAFHLAVWCRPVGAFGSLASRRLSR